MKNRMVQKLNRGKKLLLAGAGITVMTIPIAVGILSTPRIRAQPVPTPKFEVASIRPCQAGNGPVGFRVATGSLRVVCLSVKALVGTAYMTYGDADAGSIFAREAISGGPAWFSSADYDIEAKAEGNPSGPMMGGPMLRALLEDRFKLKLHREKKDIPVYELSVAKSGFKLQPLRGSCTPIDPLTPKPPGLTQEEARAAPSQRCNTMGFLSNGVDYRAASLNQLAANLTHLVAMDRPVVNRTGIAGIFDFHLVFTPDETAPRGASFGGDSPAEPPARTPTAGPSIFTAIQQQLGLKLEPAKGPGEFLVIDHVERPSEN